jgi:hypothetical protein
MDVMMLFLTLSMTGARSHHQPVLHAPSSQPYQLLSHGSYLPCHRPNEGIYRPFPVKVAVQVAACLTAGIIHDMPFITPPLSPRSLDYTEI